MPGHCTRRQALRCIVKAKRFLDLHRKRALELHRKDGTRTLTVKLSALSTGGSPGR